MQTLCPVHHPPISQKSQVLGTERSNDPKQQVKDRGVEKRGSPQIMKRKKPIEKKPVEEK